MPQTLLLPAQVVLLLTRASICCSALPLQGAQLEGAPLCSFRIAALPRIQPKGTYCMSARRTLRLLARLSVDQSKAATAGSSVGLLLGDLPFSKVLPQALSSHACAAASLRGFAAQPYIVAATESTKRKQQTSTALTREQEEFDAITDQIPQRPVGVVEGTSYSIVILAGLAFAVAIIYAAVNELLIQPKEYACFNLALEKLRDDPRVTVRLGSPISGYGTESRNRAARQRIPHRTYVDSNGTEHVQVQFHVRGPSGVGRVSADMYKDSSKQWQYVFLYLDADVPVPSRVTVISPSQ